MAKKAKKSKTKIYISDNKICPPHRIPHKVPLGSKITDECCHIHTRLSSMAHHRPFCRILKCRNYKFMVCEYKKYRKTKKTKRH